MTTRVHFVFFFLNSGKIPYAELTKNADSAKIREKSVKNPKLQRAINEMDMTLNNQASPSVGACFRNRSRAIENSEQQIHTNENRNSPHLPLRRSLRLKVKNIGVSERNKISSNQMSSKRQMIESRDDTSNLNVEIRRSSRLKSKKI